MEPGEYATVVKRALDEDLSSIGDVTTQSVIAEGTMARGEFVARSPGVLAGLKVAAFVFEVIDPEVVFEPMACDGDRVDAGATLATVEGRARSILTCERTALNLLGRMSGVATETARLVDAVEGTGASISDTRKTMPGLRALDKYSVTMGGGVNHRLGLYDAVIIKDNHIVAAGDIGRAVAKARAGVGPRMMVEVEAESLDQLGEILATSADRVLLDNMDVPTLRRAVTMVGDSMITEASGGVTLETVRAIAQTGVDIISVGWITHSPPQLDIGLDFVSKSGDR